MKIKRCAIVVSLGLVLALLWALGGQLPSARAGAGDIYCVTPGGGSYTACDQVFTYPQAAVDAATGGEEIRVAAGHYTGVHVRGGITQVVYISKTVTVRGGYTTTDWLTPHPITQPTTLDAEGLGRVLVISGTRSAGSGRAITPTIEGLRLTGGNAAGLGGEWWSGYDAGGGVYVYAAMPTIGNCAIYSNTASTADDGYGGGLHLRSSDATIYGNTVTSNTASTAGLGFGGGLYIYDSNDTTLNGNTVQGNMASTADGASGTGGGLYFFASQATLEDNTVVGNIAGTGSGGDGGGLQLVTGDVTLIDNRVQDNTASKTSTGHGGGLHLQYSDATLRGNVICSNTASTAGDGYGGGLYLLSSDATLQGNMVISNTTGPPGADGRGGGVYLEASAPRLAGNTVQDNAADAGGGLFVYTSTGVISRNLIIDNHASYYGGGMFLWEGASPVMEGNVVMSNTAAGAAADDFAGGGLVLDVKGGTRITLTNHIVAHNKAGAGGHTDGVHCLSGSCALLHCTIVDNHNGEGVRLSAGGGTNVVWNSIIAGHSVGITVPMGYAAALDYNDYFDNDTDVGGATWGAHHRTDDPQFENRAGSAYHLRSSSPLIDVGDDSPGVRVDFEGDPRPIDGDGDGTATADIGADEFEYRVYLPLILRNH